MPRQECITKQGVIVIETSRCGHDRQAAARQCLALLPSSFDQSDLRDCFVGAGCSASEAADRAEQVLARCQVDEAAGREDEAQGYDLKQRQPIPHPHAAARETPFAAQLVIRADSTSSPSPSPTPTGSHRLGSDCFKYGVTSTTSCLSETVDGKVKTRDCESVPLTTSDCLHGYICTVDASHQDVCMEAHNVLDTPGIVLTIVFGSLIALGLAYIAFACCQERRHQKRIAKKAEAAALVRATTMKQKRRPNDVHAPLIQQQQTRHYDGDDNPFHENA